MFFFKKLMEANYYSAVYATKAAIGSMVDQQAGRVVFLSSQAGQIGLFGFSAYSASKFALRGLAEALQMEVRYYCLFVKLMDNNLLHLVNNSKILLE